MLDLFSGGYINLIVERSRSDHVGQALAGSLCLRLIGSQPTSLHARSQRDQLGKVDPLPLAELCAQLVERLLDGWRLRDRVTGSCRGHSASVAPCCTYVLASA